MNIRNLTWPQVIVLVACLAATFGAYKLLGPEAGNLSAIASTIVTFLLGRDPPTNPPSGSPLGTGPWPKLVTGAASAAALLVALLFLQGCAWFEAARPVAEDVASQAAQISRCARDAGSEDSGDR